MSQIPDYECSDQSEGTAEVSLCSSGQYSAWPGLFSLPSASAPMDFALALSTQVHFNV